MSRSHISPLDGLPVIDESPSDLIDGRHGGKGWEPRDFAAEPFGSMSLAVPLDIPLIPRDEWDERIKDMEATKTRLTDLCDAAGLVVKNQQMTNYCWINAPVHLLEVLRVAQGQEYVSLSPASCGGPITNYANARGNPAGVGGWGTKGLKYLAEKGAAPSHLWPDNTIDKRLDTAAANAERPKYRVTEWYDVQPGSFDAVMTCLLLRIPVAIGLSWWGHEVSAVDPVKLDGRGQYGATIDNSWGKQWGKNGRGVLTESRATPNDAVAPRVVVAS